MRFLDHRQNLGDLDLGITLPARESGLDTARTTALVRLAGKIRGLSGMDLEEGVSTRLLIYTAKLMTAGVTVNEAIRVAIIEPLSDDDDVKTALSDLVATVYG